VDCLEKVAKTTRDSKKKPPISSEASSFASIHAVEEGAVQEDPGRFASRDTKNKKATVGAGEDLAALQAPGSPRLPRFTLDLPRFAPIYPMAPFQALRDMGFTEPERCRQAIQIRF